MKILLLGEYSGVHTNLRQALAKLGHEVVMASDGDGFKNFNRDIDLKGFGRNKITRTLSRIITEYKAVEKLKGFDVVQIINPLIFSQFVPEKNFFNKILRNNDKVFLTALGDDHFFWKAYRDGKFKHTPLTAYLKFDVKKQTSNWEYGRLKSLSEYLAHNVNAVIPCAYTYYLGYKDLVNVAVSETIPFPIDVHEIKLQKLANQSSGKVMFLHGMQRQRTGFKGSLLIHEAMTKLKDQYASHVEYRETQNVPYHEYFEMLNGSTVIIDQVNGYEPGMNALISMAKGKVVMGGCKAEWMDHMKINYEPLVDISPDAGDIYRKAENLILNPEKIKHISKHARKFVEDFHDSHKVAQKFLETWQNY